MKPTIPRKLDISKRRLARRLEKTKLGDCRQLMFSARNLHYEIADRCRGISYGGIGAIHFLARQLGLIDAIDDRLHRLKFHFPCHESDHVLTFAYNALCDGACSQDLELRRHDEVFLDALGARRPPDPTTAGDFCRRTVMKSPCALQNAVGCRTLTPGASIASGRNSTRGSACRAPDHSGVEQDAYNDGRRKRGKRENRGICAPRIRALDG